jgi:hypothetical protein
MVSMLASDRVRPKTIKLVFAAGSKSKDWFTLNQDNVSNESCVVFRVHGFLSAVG